MGRRKERRLAAISAAGRRVKLDLFAEPTGEVAGKPLHDEAGGGLGQEKCADVPNSPSSSGQKQENPLLLLGQYSDDEVDDSASKKESIAPEGTSSIDTFTKVEGRAGSNEGSDLNADGHTVDNSKLESDGLDVVNKLDGILEDNNEPEPGSCFSKHSSTEISCSEDFGMLIIGDYASDWKIVMHEESKRCYYWNTETGETSWEVPDVSSDAGKISMETPQIPNSEVELTGAKVDGLSFVSVSGSESAISASGKEISQIPKVVSSPSGAECEVGEVGRCGAAASESADFSSEHLAVCSEYDVREASVPQIFKDTSEHCEASLVHETEVIRKCENLLEKLKAIKGSGNGSFQQTWAYKYVIEVETRLFDCKELLSFGSSILPFWRNTEIQLERIETIIREETSGIRISGDSDEVGDLLASSSRSDHSILEKGGDEVVTAVNAASKSQEENLHLDTDQYPVEANIKTESPDKTLEAEEKEIKSGILVEQSSSLQTSPKVDSDAHEVDMDVEMEVDDEIPIHSQRTTDSVDASTLCPLVQQDVLTEIPPLPSDEFKVPPPPDEEWIPPPPPDYDQIPPPPPDNDPIPPPTMEEPPIIVTPPYAEPVHPHTLPYADQYDVGYSAPGYQYYTSSVTEGQSTSYYSQSHIDGSHVAQAHPAQYFGASPSGSYPSAPVTVPVEPAVFYDVHTGTVPPGIVSTSFETSVIYAESRISNPSKISTGSVELVKRADEKVGSVSQMVETEPAGIQSGAEKASIQVAASSVVTSTMGNASANERVAATTSAASVKNPSKVARTKKRVVAVSAPTLRSNKKVSSLVDKWKAAKEELHGDEDDEAEDAYEILERKKKKQIEEWHARQITSGEAQDNANFVPIRGDWRERVKRKRTTEPSAESSHPAEQVVEERRQPDLVELAKGLPPGWQAYWDESSKEVYYGNLRTSETTWTRPSS